MAKSVTSASPAPPSKEEVRPADRLWPVVGIVAALLAAFVLLDFPIIRSDGLAYYLWLQSIVADGDLDLANQATNFQEFNIYQAFLNPQTGRYATVFSFGPALLWAPFYAVSLALDDIKAFHINDAHFIAMQGDILAHTLSVVLATNFYALLAAVASFLLASRYSSSRVAALASLSVFFGTPLLYYATIEAFFPHIIGAFLMSIFLYLAVLHKNSWRFIFLMGLILGLAALVRWQLVLFGLPFGVTLLLKRDAKGVLAYVAGLSMLLWLVPYTWNYQFGSPFITPAQVQNSWPYWVGPKHLLDILISPQRGMFLWSPITLLALIGLLRLYPTDKGVLFSALGVFGLQLALNGSVWDWWVGDSFGMRRMTEFYPYLVVGIALLFKKNNSQTTAEKPAQGPGIPGTASSPIALRSMISPLLWSLVALSVVWSILLLLTYSTDAINHTHGTVLDAAAYWLGGPDLQTMAETFGRRYGIANWADANW